MRWHKIVLTDEQIIMVDALSTLLVNLASLEDKFDLPKGFAVFGGYDIEAGKPIYFTPDTSQYISDLMFNYGGSPCKKPEYDKIDSLIHCPCADSEHCWLLLKS